MAASETPQGSKADWVTDRILRGMISALLLLPYERRVRLMGTALRRVIGPLVGYRKRAEGNLAMIYPDMPKDRRRELAGQVCDNFGRTLIENYSWQEFGQHLSSTIPTGKGLEALAEAKETHRPVIFVTAHFGNHEAPRQVLTAMGYTIGGLYRPMGNPYFNDHYARTMTSWGGPVFAQGRRGTMGFARHIRSGGMATLLFDVSSKGEKIDFLGKPADTATSAAEIALRLDALVIPYFGIRKADGFGFDVVVEAPIKRDTPRAMMIEITKRLEARIENHPEQWFWIHRRWKSRKNG